MTEKFGIGCLTTIFLILAVLKIAGLIELSWIWVTAPLWGPIALIVAGFALLIFIAWKTGGK